MGKLGYAAAAVVFASMLATVPSKAELLGGGPIRNGNQCWSSSPGGNATAGFGYWAPCPTPERAAARGAELRHPLRPRRDRHDDR
jgi:hypothetical protein